MSLPTKPVLGVLVDNLSKRQSVMPMSHRRSVGWADGLDLPMGGDTVIYTGLMYQLMPSIMALEKITSRFENSWMNRFFGVGRMINKVINVSRFMMRVNTNDQNTFNGMLRNIVCLLKTAGVKFGYLYGQDVYTGALLHDEGVCNVFKEHALRVFRLLEQQGVKQVITVDPHTTDMLRTVYPKFINDYNIEVKSYLEVLAECNLDPLRRLNQDVAIHDSCVYARYEGIIDQPRQLLEKAGVRIAEPDYSKKMTFCCGGPVESLYPSKARAIAEKRIEQLAGVGSKVVAMCPICLINLRSAAEDKGIVVRDISEYLVEAYCDRSDMQAAGLRE